MLKYIPFVPKLYGDYLRHFYNAAEKIHSATPINEVEQIIIQEISWVEELDGGDLLERKKYRAVILFLRDLLRASWKANFNNNVLELSLPNLDDKNEKFKSLITQKSQLRQWMSESRLERLYSYKDFIDKMETPNKNGYCIQNLIADGNELYKRIISMDYNSINPYLELVDESNDKITGLKLSDIWRYFRLTWSTPAETTPGRTIQYLIRDANHQNHAVMGIASLENSAVQITDRDNFLGWSPKIVIEKVNQSDNIEKSVIHNINLLLRYISEGINNIDYSDLSLNESDIMNPDDKIVNNLHVIALDAENARQNSLIINKSMMISKDEKSELGTISMETETNLYKRKRADQVAKFLNAKRQLLNILKSDDIVKSWNVFSNSDYGYSAIRTALLGRKMQHIGSSIMELNICGGVQPYNELLSGKLVALLATSPKIIYDYEKKYGNKKSEIATRLKNEDVIRPAKLVYIGTTSLYYVGSSQYNRLKIPKEVFDKSQFDVKWEEIGMTLGFGSMHISRATSQAFQEILNSDIKKINHIFGEGSSPKMRIMTNAIRELLYVSPEESKELSKHAMARIVYGSTLISNLDDYLLGQKNVKPNYYCDINLVNENTQRIIKFWKDRWLKNRIHFEPALTKIREFDKFNYLVGTTLKREDRWSFKELKEVDIMQNVVYESEQIDFLRGFYKGSSAYSDFIEASQLKKIHVETKLDKSIVDELSKGNDVVLTGNPGDGKTHIVRVLSEEFKKNNLYPVTEIDASTKTSHQIHQNWVRAREEGKQFIIAINAAVLYALKNDYPDFKPISSAFNQMIHSTDGYIFDENDLNNVVLFDLSKRNILHKEIVKDVVKKFIKKDNFSSIKKILKPFENYDIYRNILLLNDEIFIERIYAIFNRLFLMGYHATLRELQSFFSYLLLGDRDIRQLIKTSSNDTFKITELIYNGKGQFFEELKKTFDPIRVSHPQIDEDILYNKLSEESWIEGFQLPKGVIKSDQKVMFYILKREFYFFNSGGGKLLDISDDYVTKFDSFLHKSNNNSKSPEHQMKEQKEELITLINMFFGNDKDSKKFDVWQGHRYDFSQRKILFSIQTIRNSDLTIEIPKLNSIMSRGIDYSHNYLYLVKKDSSIRLKVDFEFYSMLLNVERGIPMLYMDNDMVKRMWAFIEQLNNSEYGKSDDDITVSLFNVQSKKRIKVDLDKDGDEYRYTKIK